MQTLSFLSSVGGLKKIKDNLLYFFYCLTFVKELSFLFQIHFVKTGQTLHSGNINMNQSKHSYEPINSKAILTQTLSFLVPPSQVWYVEFSIENKVQMVVRVFCLYLQFNLCLCLNWYFSHTHLSFSMFLRHLQHRKKPKSKDIAETSFLYSLKFSANIMFIHEYILVW